VLLALHAIDPFDVYIFGDREPSGEALAARARTRTSPRT
jgi:hypothetical protein